MSAMAKLSRFLRRLVHFRQMDFEFAGWQMWSLLTHPQLVYRKFVYRKRMFLSPTLHLNFASETKIIELRMRYILHLLFIY